MIENFLNEKEILANRIDALQMEVKEIAKDRDCAKEDLQVARREVHILKRMYLPDANPTENGEIDYFPEEEGSNHLENHNNFIEDWEMKVEEKDAIIEDLQHRLEVSRTQCDNIINQQQEELQGLRQHISQLSTEQDTHISARLSDVMHDLLALLREGSQMTSPAILGTIDEISSEIITHGASGDLLVRATTVLTQMAEELLTHKNTNLAGMAQERAAHSETLKEVAENTINELNQQLIRAADTDRQRQEEIDRTNHVS